MTTILQILASPRPQSFSRQIAREVTARLVSRYPAAEIIERDLAADPPPHPEIDLYEAILSPAGDDDPRFALSERLMGELEAADFGRHRAWRVYERRIPAGFPRALSARHFCDDRHPAGRIFLRRRVVART